MKVTLQDLGFARIAALNRTAIGESNARETNADLAALLVPDSRLILDLQGLAALDASGLGLLLRWIRQARKANMHLCVCGASNQVRALFELISLHQTVPICETREEALLYFQTAMAEELSPTSRRALAASA